MAEKPTAKTNSQDLLSSILGSFDSFSPAGAGATQARPTPQTPQEFDQFLDGWQSNVSAADAEWGDYFKDRAGAFAGMMPQMPELPDFSGRYQEKREAHGITELEADLNELRKAQREQEAIRRERIEGTFGERTRMSAIQGQVSEIERQEQFRLDAINRGIQTVTDQINTAYNAINIAMQFYQMDYQAAMEQYDMKFRQNMTIYQQLRGEYESDRQFEMDQARSNLQIYMDMISDGQMTYADLDSATKAEISKLEMRAGLPKGFMSNVRMSPGQQVQSITTREVGGVQYADILKWNPSTQKWETETQTLGRVDVRPTGGTGGAASTEPSVEQITDWAKDAMKLKMGSDGFVSPNTWNQTLEDWVDMGNPARLFIDTFRDQFVNEEHQKKWGGYKLF